MNRTLLYCCHLALVMIVLFMEVNPFLTGPELTSAETCHPIRYSILRVYYYMNLYMLFSTGLNIMFYTT